MTPTVTPLVSPLGEAALMAWESAEYTAGMFPQGDVLRFSVARVDGSPAPFSWEELMAVKRECGFGDLDAVEVYPRDADIFNTGNVRHLYFIGSVGFALRHNTHTLQKSNTGE